MLTTQFTVQHRETGTKGICVSQEIINATDENGRPVQYIGFTVLWDNEDRTISRHLADELRWDFVPGLTEVSDFDEEDEEFEGNTPVESHLEA